MKPGFIAMIKINASMIARELLRNPQAIVATINALVSPSAADKKDLDGIILEYTM